MEVTCYSMERRSVAAKPMAFVRWLVPDLALALALVTFVYCLFLFDGTRALFRDSDSGWHIRTGERILDDAALPAADSYSLLRSGKPWFAWEWGADVLMGAAHRWAGLAGVAILYALLIAACTWLWIRVHWAAGGDFLLACAMAMLMLSTVNLHWLARPHVFSWALLLLALWRAERVSHPFDWRDGVVCASFGALWANLHASFFLAPVMAIVYALGAAARPLLWDEAVEVWRSRWYLLAAVCTTAGTLINPYGWGLHRHIARYLSDTDLLDRVAEFQSFNFHVAGAPPILVGLGFAAAGGVLALGHRRVEHFLLAVLVGGLALRSARGLPLAALLLLPLANGAIARALTDVRGLRNGVRSALDEALGYSRGLRRLDAGMSGFAIVPAVILITAVCAKLPPVQAHAGFPEDQFPVAAAAAVEKLPADSRLLAPDKFGGFLIYRFNGARKVYFDGRSDFYGSQYMRDYLNLIEVRPGWREQLDRIGFTHALLPVRYSLIPALEQIGWKKIYADATAVVLERHQ